MIDPLQAADKLIDAVDDNYLSEQESEDIRTERQRIDMQSDNPMAKIIRPLVTLLSGLVWAFAIVYSFFKDADPIALASATSVFVTCVGFYFHSRRQEKMQQKKADTALKIERMKTRHELREEKRDNRAERKEDRRQ